MIRQLDDYPKAKLQRRARRHGRSTEEEVREILRNPVSDQPAESIWTTTITVFEVRTGIELLEQERRRRQLEQAFAELLAEDLGGRVQSFDQAAALAAGRIAAARQRAGRPVEVRDVQIAGIATARRAILATRNARHFDELGVELVDPWSA